MKKLKKRLWFRILNLILVFSMIVPVLCTGKTITYAEEDVIKVGYDLNSSFIQETNGEYFGYGVEYLDKIAEYTKWDYEYVKDASWQESLDKLRKGEIDLICTVHYTEERAEEFLYSDIPLGYETTLLYANTDTEIFYQDYEAINGCKVGLLAESYSAKEFISYMEEHELVCEVTYFEREDEMLNALANREIDLLAVGSRYATSDMQIIDRLGANAFYCITNKENEELIEEIDDALQQIMFDSPSFEGELNETYFGHGNVSHTPLYTKEELAYIQSLDTIKVKIMLNQHPSCYEEGGIVKGIWIEYLKLLSEKSGINFEVEIGDLGEISEDTYDDYLQQGYLLFRTQRAREYNNREDDNITTISLMDIDLSYLERKEEFMENTDTGRIVALTKDLAFLETILLEQDSECEVIYYEDSESCFEALVNEEVDMIIQNAFWASYLMQKPEYADKLTEVPGVNYENHAVLVMNEDQQMLADILDKAINHVSTEEKDGIVTKELLLNPYPIGIDDIWYQYREWIIVIAVGIMIALAVYTVLTRKMANLKVKKKEFELLQRKLQLDELTGLYNRSYFFEKARELIDNSNEDMCIVMMNVLNFKVINELYGMPAGDDILKEIAEQMLKIENVHIYIPARFTADYFFMCIPQAELDRITLPKMMHTSLEDMDIRVVYGVFQVQNQKELPVNVMCDRANTAAHDKSYQYTEYVHFYNDAQRQKMLLEQDIERDMEQALEEKQFYIVIQPKYDAAKENIVGGEALVRWMHPQKGIISPGLFIPVFEKNGFIIQLDYFVWEETCRLQAKLKSEGVEIVPISINVSRAHFYGQDLMSKLDDLLKKYGLEPKDLELEITESICGENTEIIYDIIRQLQAVGFKIAMDDFGSGYSSLNMLKEMPLDILKMDLKFLDGDQEKGRHILGSLIDMAYTIGLKVVVEGVEIVSQVEFLRQFEGCTLQGFYFSRPIVGEEYEKLLEK